MNGNQKAIEESTAMDLILQFAIDNATPVSAPMLKKEILTGISIDEIKYLIKKMSDKNPDIADIRISPHHSMVIANGMTIAFLNQGGFSKLDNEISDLKKHEAKKEKL